MGGGNGRPPSPASRSSGRGRRSGRCDASRAVDLFPGALADIADPQVAGRPIEREAPRVAEPDTPRSGRAPNGRHTGWSTGCRTGSEPVRRLTSIRRSLPRSVPRLCARLPGSPPLPPSPSPMYRYPSGPNAMCPPLWLSYGWLNPQQGPATAAVHAIGVRRDAVLADDAGAVEVRVAQVELAVGLVARVEREPEQALLAAPRHERESR